MQPESQHSFLDHVSHVLDELFLHAKSKDEFEYICSLLRIRGMEGPGWDPLNETHDLVSDLLALINGPLREATRIRLALLTFCHLMEVDAIYVILKNMLNTIEGNRCSTSPFHHLYRRIPPSAKTVVTDLRNHAERLGQTRILEVLGEMFNDAVRNSFFHSDYIIYEDEYRTREGQFLKGDTIEHSIKIDELANIIDKGIAFYTAFFQCFRAHITSYKEPKTIVGRIGANNSLLHVQLLVHPERGVYGFRSFGV